MPLAFSQRALKSWPMKILLLLSTLCMLLPLPYAKHAMAGEIEFNGQASVWAIGHDE